MYSDIVSDIIIVYFKRFPLERCESREPDQPKQKYLCQLLGAESEHLAIAARCFKSIWLKFGVSRFFRCFEGQARLEPYDIPYYTQCMMFIFRLDLHEKRKNAQKSLPSKQAATPHTPPRRKNNPVAWQNQTGRRVWYVSCIELLYRFSLFQSETKLLF